MLFDRSLQHDIDFSQDCSIRSYHFASLTFCCCYYKNGFCFFSFSKFTFYLKSKHFTMSQYNNRGLSLVLNTPSQIKMYKTIKISLVYILDFFAVVDVIAENGETFKYISSLQKMEKHLSTFSK